MANLTITATDIVRVSGPTLVKNAGVAITAGQIVYLEASSDTLKLADANGTAAVASVVGIALNGGGVGQPIKYALPGSVVQIGAGTQGALYVLSETAGAIAVEGDISSASFPVYVGVVDDSTQLYFNPHVTGVAHA